MVNTLMYTEVWRHIRIGRNRAAGKDKFDISTLIGMGGSHDNGKDQGLAADACKYSTSSNGLRTYNAQVIT
jgi:hypothetical protein